VVGERVVGAVVELEVGAREWVRELGEGKRARLE
jgi:hypothetical protein